MTISNPDIVTILRQRIDQCRCLGAVPATRCCGGCEHDGRCLTAIVEARRERDESRWFAKEAIDALTKERDEARREVCKSAGILRSVVDPNQEVDEWANYIAKVNNWDCFKKEETP